MIWSRKQFASRPTCPTFRVHGFCSDTLPSRVSLMTVASSLRSACALLTPLPVAILHSDSLHCRLSIGGRQPLRLPSIDAPRSLVSFRLDIAQIIPPAPQ